MAVPLVDGTTGAGDYAAGWALAPVDAARGPGDWARDTFEGAPGVVRTVLLWGWRWGLGLRLDPGNRSTVLGWRITRRTADGVTVSAASRLLTASNEVIVEGSSVTWTTRVTCRNRGGAVLWRLAAPLHEALLPRLLTEAARRR